METETENKQYVVKRDDERDLTFTGKRIAVEDTRTDRSTRWETYEIYQTVGKNTRYVLTEGYVSMWQGESDAHSASIFGTLEDLFAKMTEGGIYNGIVKSLAKQVNFDLTEHLD